jgi:16S rRNA G966 N2-methylase RsmD
MRIIAGTVGGRTFRAPKGDATRPTSDKVREAIFNILLSRGEVAARVLDLYAGSGAFGLEALSRGAEQAVFVEEDRATAQLIRDNADTLELAASCQVQAMSVANWLTQPTKHSRGKRAVGGGSSQLGCDEGGRESPPLIGSFGWVFVDPPYAGGELERALRLLAQGNLVEPGGLVIAEHEWRNPPSDRHGTLALFDQRRYGQTAVSFYSAEAQ